MPPKSGNDGHKSEAVEKAWAALLMDDLDAERREALRGIYDQTPGGAPFAEVVDNLRGLARRFPLKVVSAERTRLSVNSDVDAVLEDGTVVKFEVKAQVKKAKFSDIVQSDWVRDQTDLLSKLVQKDDKIFNHFKPVGADMLKRVKVSHRWSIAQLHLADIAGLTNKDARKSEGVKKPGDLKDFLERKWFLHVTQEGARLCRYSDLAPVRYLSKGKKPNWTLKENKKGRALLSAATPGGKAWFTYHLYPSPTLKGRHKIHPAAFDGVKWILPGGQT